MKKKAICLFFASVPLFASCEGGSKIIDSFSSSAQSDSDSKPQSQTTSKEIPGEVQVILLGGQSNMEGHTYVEYLTKTCGEAKATEYVTGYNNVKIAYHNTYGHNTSKGKFTSVKTGEGYDNTRFGPEVGMAEEITNRKLQKPVVLIKWAVGGTTLSGDWRSTSSGSAGSCYVSFVDYVKTQLKSLEDEGYFPVIKAFFWMQGEDDASGSDYSNYLKYERNLIKDIRDEKGIAYYARPEGIGFVDAGIDDCVAWTHYVEINEAKKTLASESPTLNRYFSTIDNNLSYNGEPAGSPDIYHFDSSSEIKLGNLFIQTAIDAGFLE